MKKYFKLAAFAAAITIALIVLPSGITKDKYDGGGYKDLVDELYDQAVKQNDNLETIEEDINKFYKNKQEAVERYTSYINYNSRYYQDARAKTSSISNADTKQRGNDIILKSEAAYKAKVAELEMAMNTLITKERQLKDLHTLLKITITEPMINKSQNSSLPDKNKLNEASGELQQILDKIKTITK